MSTAAAKQRRKVHNETTSAVAVAEVFPPKTVSSSSAGHFANASPQLLTQQIEISDRAWLLASVGILVVAAFLRLYALELKPMHHDEGVNGFFLTNLIRQGIYRYDPANYHGPTLYYLAVPLVSIFGLNTFAVRLLTTLAGLLTILLVLDLKRYIGKWAALAAALLIAVSPGAVFYSRYFIHETLFVLFTLGIVSAALRFYQSKRTLFLVLGAISAALLFATKETAFVSLGTLGLAWLVARLWVRHPKYIDKVLYELFRFPISEARRKKTKELMRENREGPSLLKQLGGRDQVLMFVLTAVGLFVFVNVLFYSSFFTNWPGIKSAVESLQIWTKTGTSQFHEKPFGTYVTWLLQEETPITLLALAGAYFALFSKKINRFAVFVGAWAFGIFLAYSLIPYKTPWLMLSFVIPMGIVGGYAIQNLMQVEWGKLRAPLPAMFLMVTALTISGYQSLVLNYHEYDNDRYPYVYSHTSRELNALVDHVDRIARKAGTKEIGVSIATPENWPLPWYFRDYPRVGYVGNVSDKYDPTDTPVVIGRESQQPNEDQTAKLESALGAQYAKVGSYALRPGVRLALFARRDLVTQ